MLPRFQIRDNNDNDPILLGADGIRSTAWRENYPYDERMHRGHRERVLKDWTDKLQSETRPTITGM